MEEKMKYSKICAFIENALDEYIPKRYVSVMFDNINYMYIIKIKNAFGIAEYEFTWSSVMTNGVNFVVNSIKRDFLFPKECEE